MMDAKWTPRRKSYSPSWLRDSSGDVYGEQRREYEEYAKHLQVGQADARSTDSGSTPLAAATKAAPAASPPVPPPVPDSHSDKNFASEATRDPAPTYIDPDDPRGKQQEATHRADTFAEYLAKRKAL